MIPRVGVRPLRVPDIADNIARPVSPRVRRRDRARLGQDVNDGADNQVEPVVPPLSPRLRRGPRGRPAQEADEEAADACARAHGRLQRPSNSRRSRHNESLPEVSSSDDQRPRRNLRYHEDDDSSPDGDDSFFAGDDGN